MGRVKFQLNLPGLNELMKSGEMQEILREACRTVENNAENMATDPKAGYHSDVVVLGNAAVGRVHANNDGVTMRENYKHNTLVKALSASGLKMTKG